MKFVRFGAALAVATAFHGAAAQATRPTDSTTASLGAVVVTATRATTTLEHMPLHASVITRDDIKKSPAQSLDQLLREVPGINLSGAPFYTTDPTGHQTRLRGVSNSKVLVLLDGIPIHDPFYSTTQWFKVPLSAIERVEVVRGGNSSLWGNLAVAGVINIITRKPLDSNGQVDVSYQSMRTLNAALSKNFLVGNGLSLRLSGDMLKTDGYQTTPSEFLGTVPGKAASSARNSNVQVAVYYAPAVDFSAYLRAGYHEQNEDIGGYQYGTNLQKSPDAAGGFTRTLTEKSRVDVKLWTQYLDFDKYNGAGCYLATAANCNTISTTAPLVQYANSHDVNPYRELGGSAILSSVDLKGALASVQLGSDFRMIGGEDRATTYNRPTTTDGSAASINRTNHGKGTQQFVGVFTQFRVTPTQALAATVSLRYDHWSNTGGLAEMVKYANGVAGTAAGGTIADSHKETFNPSVSLRYDLGEHFSARGAVYKSFRAPGLNNLYRSFSSTTSITIANPGLSPETLTGGELGFDIQTQPVTLGATVFQYNTKALIASYKVPNAAAAPPAVIAICGPTLSNCPATVNFNTNSQDAISRGLELVGAWRAAHSLTVNAAYTYTDSHYSATTTGDPTGVQLGAIPTDLATLGLTWQVTPRWNSYASLRYNGPMFLDVNKTIPQTAFTLVNLSTSYQVSKQLEFYGAVGNLTDREYTDNATTSAASKTLGMSRSITSGLRVRF
jgi:iron complex outermembrane receptor protein